MKFCLVIAFVLSAGIVRSQTLGGNTVFTFLQQPYSPRLTAAGGVSVSRTDPDLGLALYNPALLRPALHSQLHTVFNSHYAGIKGYHLSLGYHYQPWKTSFAFGLNYLDYGNLQETDASGNIFGQFRPRDYVLQVSAARAYLEKWNYGVSVKYISSNYGQFRSNGIAVDAGLHFQDSSRLFSASIAARNMGFQLKKYTPGNAEELPFDLVAGITKKLDGAPFGFSVTATHLHQFDIRYNDTVFNQANGSASDGAKKFTLDKLFRHIVLAADIYLGDKVTVTAGYNHLRRQELNVGKNGNGLNGFSMGAGLHLKKLQVHVARAQYQNNTGYNQLGLHLTLNEYFGLGKWGSRIGW